METPPRLNGFVLVYNYTMHFSRQSHRYPTERDENVEREHCTSRRCMECCNLATGPRKSFENFQAQRVAREAATSRRVQKTEIANIEVTVGL